MAIDKGTLITDFSDGQAAWTASGTGTAKADTIGFSRQGTKSIAVTCPNATGGIEYGIWRTFSPTLDLSAVTHFYLSLYLPPVVSSITPTPLLYCYNNIATPTGFRTENNWCPAGLLKPGWNDLIIPKSAMVQLAGGGDWATAITEVRVGGYYATAGVAQAITVDSLYHSYVGSPVVQIHFDDAYQTVFTNAMPAMEAAGIKGTVYVITDLVSDTPGTYMSWSQLRTLERMGWTIGSHGKAHIYYSGGGAGEKTTSTISTDMQTAFDALVAHGIKNPQHIAWPYGAYNNQTPALASRSYATGRRTNLQKYQAHPTLDGSSEYHISSDDWDLASQTAADVLAEVDALAPNGGLQCLLFHGIADGAVATAFADVVTGLATRIAAESIICMTMHDYHAWLVSQQSVSLLSNKEKQFTVLKQT